MSAVTASALPVAKPDTLKSSLRLVYGPHDRSFYCGEWGLWLNLKIAQTPESSDPNTILKMIRNRDSGNWADLRFCRNTGNEESCIPEVQRESVLSGCSYSINLLGLSRRIGSLTRSIHTLATNSICVHTYGHLRQKRARLRPDQTRL